MMDATLILIDCDAELARARALVDELWHSDDPADIARLEAQARLIAAYEERKWPRQLPSTADLIHHLMDQHGLTRADLVPILGTPSRVSEVLRGKKGLAWRWCSACVPVSACRPTCSFRLCGKHRQSARRSAPLPDASRTLGDAAEGTGSPLGLSALTRVLVPFLAPA
ncbi:MAG: type II toxin-antitoxin system HigA family antitoxin [Alphaproteobacteria bacterium]